MADTKTSDLTALTGANVAQTADVIPIVDTDATTLKKILVSELAKSLEVHGTEQATTSGTAINFTSIPAWVKRITVMFIGVSTDGSSNLLVQIGDTGGVEATGYTSGVVLVNTPASSTSTIGFIISNTTTSASVFHGAVTLMMEDSSDFTWVSTGLLNSAGQLHVSAGSKATSAALDRVTITTVNGTDAFDAGAINILYE